MHCVTNIREDLYWLGASDRRLAKFENVFPIPRGVSYNAYLVLDEKTVLLDTVDKAVGERFFENLEFALAEKLDPADKGRVVGAGSSCGVDLGRFDLQKKEAWRRKIRATYGAEGFVYGFMGRINRDKGINELLAANTDKPIYNYILGLRKYYKDKDYEAAIKVFKEVAKDSPEGYTMQAVCLANKNYGKRDVKKAIKTLEKAVKKGSVVANYYLSSLYGQDGDKDKALELLRTAADGGVAFAQCKLGDMFFSGDGIAKDYVKAAEYYLKAEKQNYLSPASAQNLIVCYERGISSLPDINNSKQRIAELKETKPNNNLVDMLWAITE